MAERQGDRLFTPRFTMVWLASLLYNVSFQLPTAALPLFALNLGAGEAEVGLLTGLFALMAMLGRTVVGWQLDRGAKRLVLAGGALLFSLCALGYSLATSVLPLLALRLLNGLGHAAGQTANQALITDNAPPDRRGEALSMQLLTLTLALATMPFTGVAVAQGFGFTALFGLIAAGSLLTALLALRLHEAPPRPDRPPPQFFNRAVLRPGVLLFALMLAFGAVFALAPVHAARVGLPNAGLVYLAYALGNGVAQFVGGRLSDRRGRGMAIVPGLALAVVGLWAVALASGPWLLPAAGLFGIGVGLAQPTIIALAADYVPPPRRGSAIATVGIFLELGISAGATAGGVIGQAAGLPVAFLTLSALPALVFLALALSPWGRRTLSPGDVMRDA
jgi:MFS family permease